MTFVTKLTFQSGDRAVLEETVTSLKELVERKGGQCKGPHSAPPETLSVPQYRTLQPGAEFPSWGYTVYTRRIDIHGADHIAREVGHMDFPESIHVEIEVEQHTPLGQGQS
jgi:ribosomal protein S10